MHSAHACPMRNNIVQVFCSNAHYQAAVCVAGVNTTGIVEKIPEQLLKCFRRVIETSTITENGVDELIAGLLDVAGLSEVIHFSMAMFLGQLNIDPAHMY